MPHRIIPFPDDTIPGFELARLEWEYPLSADATGLDISFLTGFAACWMLTYRGDNQ